MAQIMKKPWGSPEPAGRLAHDDGRNAIWQATQPAESDDTVHRLLRPGALAMLERAQAAGEAAARGYDPYAKSRVTPPSQARPRTDLRALSAQILAERNRKLGRRWP